MAYAALYGTGQLTTPDRSDGLCHYVYLPAWVVHHDASLNAVADAQFGGRFPPTLQISWRPGTGRWLNAHQMGVAAMSLPFYMVGHGISALAARDHDEGASAGFSPWERHAAGLAAIFYVAGGLWLTGRLLLRRFPPAIVVVTLACLTFGTNLFHYATYDSLWSHAFSFFLFAAFLNVVEAWSGQPSAGAAFAAGLVGGLIGLVRLPNLAFLVFFALYGVTDSASLAARVKLLQRRWRDAVVVGVTCAALVLPQLLIFEAASASWWANPYEPFLRRFGIRHAFNFASPHVLDVLFSPAKGLFFWSPILLFAAIGMLVGRRRIQAFLLPTLVFVGVQTYVIASWYDWQLGGSFGHRGFTETLAVLAIPLAACFDAAARKPWVYRCTMAVAFLAVSLSVAQMLQYWLNILPTADTTWAQYRALFLRFQAQLP